ncbi:MAG: hypothetical protein OXH57_12160 [Ekhidna sp.]|nr:hypothetical protein [Ekhidna sp.]
MRRLLRGIGVGFGRVVAELFVDLRTRVGNPKSGTRRLLLLLNEPLEKQGLSVGRD